MNDMITERGSVGRVHSDEYSAYHSGRRHQRTYVKRETSHAP